MSRRAAVVLFVLYAAGFAALTLGPSPGEVLIRAMRRIDGLNALSFPAVEGIANVVLFVPLGLLLCAMLPRAPRWAVWLFCVLASISVEVIQSLLPDRQPTARDVVVNSLGAAVGVVLHAAVVRRRGRADGAASSAT